jgi:KDO2-lipid IV(A) lauroyltransferase
MASLRKKLEKRAGFFAFSKLEKAFVKKDPLAAERAGAKLGMLVYRLSAKHRTTALTNLAMAFPEMPENERVALAQRCFRHFGRVFADFLRSSTRTAKEVIQSVPLVGLENLEDALKLGKGVIVISGHFGNWERAAHRVAAEGFPLSVVARDANDSDLNRSVMRIRAEQGISVLSRGQAARGIMTKLKQNELVAILPDQNSGDIFIPFFGKPAGTVTGPSAIAVKMGAPMVPMYCIRLGPGEYETRIYPAIKPIEGYEPVEGITRAINAWLEAAIREHPEQWLWFHNRWKSARKAGLL